MAVHSKMASEDRDKRIRDFKRRDDMIRVLVNNNVLTTGFDCPEIDLIGDLQPTCSPGKHVQKYGRGTRPAEGKENCLVLDFAGNTKRLGPINDPVMPRKKGTRGGGDAPVKICEACSAYNHASVRFCTACGWEFPKSVKFEEKAATDEIVRGMTPLVEIFAVSSVSYARHNSRNPGKPDSIKATYWSGIRMFSEWVCLEHDGFAGRKAREWWRARCQYDPPDTIDEALPMIKALDTPTHIRVWVNQKHPEIMAYDFSGTAFHTQSKTSGKPENLGDSYGLDEDVPF